MNLWNLKLNYDLGGGEVSSMKELESCKLSEMLYIELYIKSLNVKLSTIFVTVLQHKQAHIGVHKSWEWSSAVFSMWML